MAQKETKFSKIKNFIEDQRRAKVQGETKLASINEEWSRIMEEASEATGKTLDTKEKIDAERDRERESITQELTEIEKIIQEEGFEL